ncbi:hypothetical protein RD792_002870 [Penstemon davidsonii]|uniref:Uncharacterized protein n=1 Tax=Penstemon davidsonii TaxID=160366 RepID=A0ABR0DTA4_9LAMI|nr:hypothetical protein RD792_002870 [Penstemon davidsonii]
METIRPRRTRRVVLVPYPYQGHMTPMLQLGSILHSKGFSIIIAHTKFNSPNPSNYPEFTFLPLSDTMEGFDTSFYNMLNVISTINTKCEASFHDYMVQLLDEEEVLGEVACIIYDSIMHFVDVVATSLKIPTMVLRTNTAAFMHSHITLFQLLEDKAIPLSSESRLQDIVPKLHPLRFKDLPLPATSETPQNILDFLHSYMDIRPCFSDQMVNARNLSHVWRVGIELEGSIEEAVRKVMVGEEGKEMRRRAINMKRELEDSVSSHESLEGLVEFIDLIE